MQKRVDILSRGWRRRLGPYIIRALLVFTCVVASAGWALPRLEVAAVTVPPGARAWVPVLLSGQDTETPLCSTRFKVRVEGGRVLAGLAGTTAEQAGKGLGCRVSTPDTCVFVVYGGPDGLPTGGDLARVLVEPGITPCVVRLVDAEGAGPDASEKAVETGPGVTLETGGSYAPHKADRDGDWKISLSELLRLIQLYNMGEYSCRAGTEDGFWPGTGERSCVPHDADYAPQDWHITLNEVLRVVQFFNLGGYGRRTGSEDGFMAGGFWVF